MRLAGTVNHKSGRHARILEADFGLDPCPIQALVGDDASHICAVFVEELTQNLLWTGLHVVLSVTRSYSP